MYVRVFCRLACSMCSIFASPMAFNNQHNKSSPSLLHAFDGLIVQAIVEVRIADSTNKVVLGL